MLTRNYKAFAVKAIENSGFEKVYNTTAEAMKPYIQKNGRVVYNNKYRIVISENDFGKITSCAIKQFYF